eukprot:1142087-Pelagomonas_calceolata.AAC.11
MFLHQLSKTRNVGSKEPQVHSTTKQEQEGLVGPTSYPGDLEPCRGSSPYRRHLGCSKEPFSPLHHKDLTEPRTQFQHLFSSAIPSSASRLRDFMNQAGVLELAKHVLLQLSCPRRQ